MRRIGALLALIVASLLAFPVQTALAAPSRPLFLIAVPDLRWSDLPHVPVLDSFAGFASVGVMSTRSEGDATRCGDGMLELSAGTRVASGVRSCDLDPQTLARLRASYRHNRFGAKVGILGDTIPGPSIAVGAAATALLTRSDGAQPLVRDNLDDAFNVDARAFVAVVDDELYTDHDRRDAQAALNTAITADFKATPPGALVMVAGISDGPTGGPHLHPLLIAGEGFPHRELKSPTTGRTPYVQLIDVLPTLLEMRGTTAVPSSVAGRAMQTTLQPVPHLSAYRDLDRQATATLSVGHPTMTGLCVTILIAFALILLGRAEAIWPIRLLLLAPVGVEVVQVVPWWRAGLWLYALLVGAVAVAGAAVATMIGVRSPRLAMLFAPGLTAAVLLADQLAGAPLQIAGAFGDNPLVAGRFSGMGNIDFGLTMACVLLVAAVVADLQRSGRRAAVVAAIFVVVALAIDALPVFGDDLGGAVSLLPAGALVVALAARVRVTAMRVVAVVVAALAAGVGVATLDYTRPASKQTHVGRFVGQVLHGDAWQVVHRKIDAVLASFDNPVVTAAVVVAVVVAIVLHRRYATPHSVAAAVLGVAVLAVLGSALNDSGVFVAAAAMLGLAPPVLAAALDADREGDTGSS